MNNELCTAPLCFCFSADGAAPQPGYCVNEITCSHGRRKHRALCAACAVDERIATHLHAAARWVAQANEWQEYALRCTAPRAIAEHGERSVSMWIHGALTFIGAMQRAAAA